MPTTAIITGALGQDGRLLSDRLINLGYRVVGIVKEAHLLSAKLLGLQDVIYVTCDFNNIESITALYDKWCPEQIYHLAAKHHSSDDILSYSDLETYNEMMFVNFITTKNLIYSLNKSRSTCHLVYAASSQMYKPEFVAQVINESSVRSPVTFYGLTKSWSTDLIVNLREHVTCQLSVAILFNHESCLRSPRFVSRKVSMAAAEASFGSSNTLFLNNIGASVDWMSAVDTISAMHLIGMSNDPGDYIVASGTARTVRELLDTAFEVVGIDWRTVVMFKTDQETPYLLGDNSKITSKLGWKITCSFQQMVQEMVKYDIQEIRAHR